ncbi:hypothetical protein BSPWISOXPB_5127 [uncultured Gammaproteobacteria bacterium]|nr:hypothetical protein BSPWISOXPB_5127 [uncultured Gammaproteobacteria bacterium]
MKTLAAHGLAGGIVQDRMGGSFWCWFLIGFTRLLPWFTRTFKEYV